MSTEGIVGLRERLEDASQDAPGWRDSTGVTLGIPTAQKGGRRKGRQRGFQEQSWNEGEPLECPELQGGHYSGNPWGGKKIVGNNSRCTPG